MSGEITIPFEQLGLNDNENQSVSRVMQYFDEKQTQFSPKLIPARDVFKQRLEQLAKGTPIDIICFNCIDFSYRASGTNYPQAIASNDTETALVSCFQQEFTEAVDQFRSLGRPRVTIVIPDSELTDENVFNFSQRERQRRSIGEQLQESLASRFTDDITCVRLWSDFLADRDLPSPQAYTQKNLPLVMGKYKKSVRNMYAETAAYLRSKGLNEEEITKINPAELTMKSAWYLAMYAGEGNAMADLTYNEEPNAVVLNFENDGKVLAWYQRGAQGTRTTNEVLPIITPADTKKFKPWKEEVKKRSTTIYEKK